MKGRIKDEVPETEASLVSIGVDLVRVFDLVTNDLVKLAALELHLLLVVLVLDDVGGAFLPISVLALSLLLVVDLTHGYRDRLPIVAGAIVRVIVEHLDGVLLLQIFESTLFGSRMLLQVLLLAVLYVLLLLVVL